MGKDGNSYGKWASLAISALVSVSPMILACISTTPSHELSIRSTRYLKPKFAEDVGSRWTPITDGLPTGSEFYGVHFGDVNNDGNLDIVAQGSGMHVYVGNGLGNFTEQSTGLPNFGGATDVVLADFNNDGNLDVAGMGIYLGNGGAGGSMSWSPDTDPGGWNAVAAADVNLDGKMDLIVGTDSGVKVWTGDGGVGGNIVWTDSSVGLPVSGIYWGVAVGDINHDGKPDIVSADRNNGIKAWTGNGLTGPSSSWTDAYTGTDLPSSDSYADVDLGDVNNDGNLDIVSTAYYSWNGVRVWLGNGGSGGSMVWTENSTGLDTMSPRYLGISLEDLDNDGDLDIFASHYEGNGLRVWLGNGGEGGYMIWTEDSDGLPTGKYIDLDAGDYNNDGKMDFVTSHFDGVEVWKNERLDFVIDSYVSASFNLPTSRTWADVQFADINHDGKLDIGFTSFPGQNQGIRVFLGDGTGVWSNSSSGLPTVGGFNGLRFADINHDGSLDIVSAQNGGNNGIHVWSGDGNGGWTERALVTTRSGSGLELADINNDGNLDVVTGYHDPSFNWGPMVFLGNGDFTWGPNVGPAGENIDVDDVAVADVNHDGKLDIAASSMDNVGIQVWTGDGSGTSTGWERNSTGLPTDGVYLGLAFADVNHDGNQDLAAAGFAGNGVGMHIWLGNGGEGGSMNWTPASSGLPSSNRWGGVEFGDTNLDGNMDLIYASSENTGAFGVGYRRSNGGEGGLLLWSDPGVSGIPTSGQHWGVAFGDMDNDGILDIAATSTSGVEVYKQGAPPARPPQVLLSYPQGFQNWTGGSFHTIWWNMTDDSPNDSLTIYLNYTYDSGNSEGIIGGPISGTANPNSWNWTTPLINASDVIVNITVVDPDGMVGWDNTVIPDMDSDPPGVLLTSPANSATNVLLDQPVVIQFDETMNRDSAISAFGITPDPGGWIWSWSSVNYTDDTMSGTHAPFVNGQTYAVTISRTALDASSPGNYLESSYSFSFTTEGPNILPTIAVESPSSNESWTGVSDHAISFIVSDVEDTSSDLLVWLNYSLTGSPPWLPIVGPISGDSSPQVWTVPGVNTTTARVRAEVLDTAGGFGLDMSGSFEIDSSPPSVLNTVPQDNEVDVGVTTSILVVWSEGMNTSSTQLSFSMADNTTWTSVAGLFSWSNDNTTMSFYPTIELEYDSWYTVNLTTASQDDSDPGNNLTSPYSWSFRTSGAPDVTPPRIENISQVPSPVEVFDVINISADIFDESGLSGAWLEIKPPTGPSSNESMTLAYGSRFYRESIWNVLGRYDYTISATDSSGLWSIALGRFDVVDISPPIITDVAVNPDPVELDGLANISATIMDDYELDGVWISIQDPNNQESNQSMELGPRHYYNKMCSVPGSYYFTIWASDSSENWAFASGGFEAVSPEGYIILDEPSQGDQIPTGGTLLLIGWVREVGTDEGFRTELVIRLETTEGDVLGSEKYTTSEANGRIFETFSVPDTILCNSEYVLRVYSNRSYVEDYLVVLKTADCAQPISIWIWLLIILVTVTAPILLALLLVLFRKKRGGEKGEDIEELPAESGEEELDDIKS